MRRGVVYLGVGILLAGCVAGIGIRRVQRNHQDGYLGKQIVYFGESTATPANSTVVERTPVSGSEKLEDEKDQGTTPLPSGTPSPTPVATPAPSYPSIISDQKVHTYDTGTVVIGNTGYEIYNYVNSAADRYAKAVNKLTKALDEGVKVYDLIAPTSVGITYPDNKMKHLNSSPQDTALKNIEKKLSGREIFVPLYDTFMKHRKEYIFFRTDHHWTQLGAYYAYEAFCREKDMTANPITSYRKKSYPGYMGTFYRDSNNNKNLKKDTLETYLPLSKNVTMEYTTAEGTKGKAPVVADVSNYGESMKYLAFIAGDNPYTVIQNKDKHDGTSCIVVKESYGNAFVPYLVDHYEKIYVIDYRYWEGNLISFIKKKRAKEVILINNISMTRNSYLIGKLSQIVS